MEKDLISVVIPCYNGDKFLERCFYHLLNQTYKKLEVILIDDGSIDNTSLICRKYKKEFEKSNIIFKYKYQSNKGIGSAVNTGLKLVTGDYFVSIDSDDYYEFDAIESLHSFLKDNTEYKFVRGRSYHRSGDNIKKILFETKSKYPNETNIFDLFITEKDAYQFSGVFMFETNSFDSVVKNRNIYPSRAGQNFQLILPMAYKYKCGYLNKIILNYVVYDNSHSHNVKKTSKLLRRCDSHKDILNHVINNIIEMPIKEKKYYLKKIRKKYFKKKIIIVMSKFKKIIPKGTKEYIKKCKFKER